MPNNSAVILFSRFSSRRSHRTDILLYIYAFLTLYLPSEFTDNDDWHRPMHCRRITLCACSHISTRAPLLRRFFSRKRDELDNRARKTMPPCSRSGEQKAALIRIGNYLSRLSVRKGNRRDTSANVCSVRSRSLT